MLKTGLLKLSPRFLKLVSSRKLTRTFWLLAFLAGGEKD